MPTKYAIELSSGNHIDVSDPKPEDIHIEDIAQALSNTCRFGGHCKRYYSVAEHAVIVSMRMEQLGYGYRLQYAALHHDDAEAYLMDVPTPIKKLFGDPYKQITQNVDDAIAEAIGLDSYLDFEDDRIKAADWWALLLESKYLLPSGKVNDPRPRHRIIVPWYWSHEENGPTRAKRMYLTRHEYLREKLCL